MRLCLALVLHIQRLVCFSQVVKPVVFLCTIAMVKDFRRPFTRLVEPRQPMSHICLAIDMNGDISLFRFPSSHTT